MRSSETRPPASITFFAAIPSGRASFDGRAQHVTCRNLGDGEAFTDEFRLGAFTRAGRSQQNQAHSGIPLSQIEAFLVAAEASGHVRFVTHLAGRTLPDNARSVNYG